MVKTPVWQSSSRHITKTLKMKTWKDFSSQFSENSNIALVSDGVLPAALLAAWFLGFVYAKLGRRVGSALK